jgi:hypothetical protein
MRTIQQLIYHSVLFLLFCTLAYPAAHYVNKNANGLNNGTSWTNAWESLADINWSSISAGDYIYVSGGTDSTQYNEGLSISGKSGTAANRITIIAGKYSTSPSGHSGRVILDGQFTRAPLIYVQNSYYVTIKGFECRNGDGHGVYYEDYGSNIIFDSLYIYNNRQAGIFCNGASTYTIDSTTIRYCRIISPQLYAGETDGVGIQNSQRTLLHDNYIRQRNQDPNAHNDCLQAHKGNGFVIYNNVFINDSVYSLEGGGTPIILGSEHSNRVMIYNNFLYMGGIWWPTGSENAVLWTRWYDSPPMPKTWIIHNTLVVNGPRCRGIIQEYNAEVVNNIITIYANSGGMALLEADLYVDSVRNNLYYLKSSGSIFAGNYTGNGQTIGSPSWTEWINTLGGTGNNTNPLLVNNIGYEPDQGALVPNIQAGSSAIDAGNNVENIEDYIDWINSQGFDGLHPHTGEWALPKTDIYGNPISNGIRDIGAFEYQSGPDLTPPRVTGATLLDSVTLVVNFSEALDQATAENENNYSITNNINVLNASLSGSKVTLQTSPHSPSSYIVTVINVEDLAGNPVDPAHNTAGYEYIVLPPDTLVMFQVQNVEGVIIEPNHTPEKTIDGLGALNGDPDSRWAAEPMPEELTFDLGTIRTVCKTKLSFYNWNAGRIYNYSVSISSDHNNWVTVVPQSTSAANQEWTVDEFPLVDARYIRVHFINNNQSSWAGLWEGQIWGLDAVPVELISFNAEYYDSKVNLEWITATENNCYGFEVQRKDEYTSYESIGFVTGNGTSTNRNIYNFRDSNLRGSKYYYRLKDISNNGEFNYSFEIQVDIPEISTFQLKQNYPNPFNPSTAIEYYVQKLSHVKLIIYNTIGQKVQTLVDGEKVPGLYAVEFNAANLPSGIYFYRLEATNFVETRKMILMR